MAKIEQFGAMKILVTHFKRCKNVDRDVMCWGRLYNTLNQELTARRVVKSWLTLEIVKKVNQVVNVITIVRVYYIFIQPAPGEHMTSRSFLTLVLPFQQLIFTNFFHAVDIANQQQQYCNTVRPQLNLDRLTQHMTPQTWRLKGLFLNYSFVFNTRYKHLYNLKLLYSGCLSEIL